MTQTEAAYAMGGAMLGGMFGVLTLFLIVFYILLIIAEWKIFTKAGESGWKSLIPFYSTYILFKISKLSSGWFIGFLVGTILTCIQVDWVMLIGAIALIVIGIYSTIKLADAFGKGTVFKVGLILLPSIFTLILGFGSAEYQE